MIKRLLVFTEGSPVIGLGHLVECQSIVDNLKVESTLEDALFVVNDDPGISRFIESRKIDFLIINDKLLPPEKLIKQYDAILVNKKSVEYNLLKYLKKYEKKVIVIDELGGRRIIADILINFSINQNRHDYIFPEDEPITFLGPEYFPASREITDALKIPEPPNSNTILVSLGGYDKSNTIEKVLNVLKEYDAYRKEVILGPGFVEKHLLKTLVEESSHNSFHFFENITDLPQRIRRSKFLINSGGDTLYEAAILGTPVLVIGEDPHEIEQGKIFEDKGFAINVSDGKKADKDQIKCGIDQMLSRQWNVENRLSFQSLSKIIY